MSSDFELIRASDNLDKLKREQDQLKFNLERTQRDELTELEKVRREYSSKVSIIEARQEVVKKEIKDAQIKQEQLKLIVDEEKRKESIDKQKKRDEERKERLHL